MLDAMHGHWPANMVTEDASMILCSLLRWTGLLPNFFLVPAKESLFLLEWGAVSRPNRILDPLSIAFPHLTQED